MKRGFIFVLAILLIMPFAFAGQVSDFFSYFTNDAFDLITGKQIGLPGTNLGPTSPIGIIEKETSTEAQKANGATCTSNGQCKSKVCTKVSGKKSICGKKADQSCAANSECFSNKCTNKKCSLSPIGKSCAQLSDCDKGLKCQNNRCSKAPAEGAKVDASKFAAKISAKPKEESAEGEEESKKLTEQISGTIDELKNKAEELLGKHKANGQASGPKLAIPIKTLPKLSSVTGNFLFQLLGGIQTQGVPSQAPSASLKSSGKSCAKNSDCTANECYKKKSSDQSGLCGRKPGRSCQTNSDCLSSKCTSKLCAKSSTSGPCLQGTDCSSNNCNAATKKCAAAAPSKTGATQAKAAEASKQITAPGLVAQTTKKEEPKITSPGAVSTLAKAAQKPSAPKVVSRPAQQKPISAACQKSSECTSKLCKCSVGTCEQIEEVKKEAAEEKEEIAAPKALDLAPKLQGLQVLGNQLPTANLPLQEVSKEEPAQESKSCTRNEECGNGICACKPGKGRCTKFTTYVAQKPKAIAPPIPVTAKEPTKLAIITPPVKTTAQKPILPVSTPPAPEEIVGQKASFKDIKWECYDGTSLTDDSSSCKTQSEWIAIANKACADKCSKETGKCGVNSFSFLNKCEEIELPKEEEVAEEEKEEFDLISAQAILDKIYRRINELKQKVCLEASKHRGIDYGNIKCGGDYIKAAATQAKPIITTPKVATTAKAAPKTVIITPKVKATAKEAEEPAITTPTIAAKTKAVTVTQPAPPAKAAGGGEPQIMPTGYMGRSCSDDRSCGSGRCENKKCVYKGIAEEYCIKNSNCLSNNCNENTKKCVDSPTASSRELGIGRSCTSNGQCRSGKCSDGICGRKNNADCGRNGDCLSHGCPSSFTLGSDTCEWSQEGELCSSNSDCATNLNCIKHRCIKVEA